MSAANGYTPTEKRILAILRDGQPHTVAELHRCLDDDLSDPEALWSRISFLRKKLEPKGQGIYSVNRKGVTTYRLVFFQDPYGE